MMRPSRSIAILFSEGSSLSARQALSALGPLGYRIDLCDPNPLCMGRFSRFVRRFHRSPSLGKDPAGYLQFILDRLDRQRYDVLLPVHEQAFLFARMQRTLRRKVNLAITEFERFRLLQSKATFAKVFAELDIPQPETQIVHGRAEIEALTQFPFYLKLPFSTAGRGVWGVNNPVQRAQLIQELDRMGRLGPDEGIVIQKAIEGLHCQAQAVFEQGSLIALHGTGQRSVGIGGSQSSRVSVRHPPVLDHLSRLGRHLGWHGALTADYFLDTATRQPVFIEVNPRLVESINAVRSGVNLPDIVVRLSLGESFREGGVRQGRAGVRTHSYLAALLSRAASTNSRLSVALELAQALAGCGIYEGSTEDLTPLDLDPVSIVPVLASTLACLVRPRAAKQLSSKAIADYSLTPQAVRTICDLKDI